MADPQRPLIDASVLAALATGDRWLNADAAALHLGMVTPSGTPNRRGFLERVACLPDFPAPMQTGAHRAWRRSDVDRWAENQRRSA